VTYFNLRKRAPEAEPDDAEEPFEEVGEEQEQDREDVKEKAAPTSWGGALWCGISGPSAWVYAHTNIEATLILHAFMLWAIDVGGGWIAAGIVALWLWAVLAFVPPEYKDRATAWVERRFTPAPKPPAEPAPGGEREVVRRLLLDIIGDAHGVHLKTVLSHLQEHGQWEGRKVADLRVHLEALGIPVDPKLKVAGVPTRGVLRTALEALPSIEETPPSPTPSPSV
jgi:hypothetical protein